MIKWLAKFGMLATNVALVFALMFVSAFATGMLGIPGLIISIFGFLVFGSLWFMACAVYNKFMEE